MSSGNELLFGDEPDDNSIIELPDRDDGKEYLVLVVDDDVYVHQLTKMVLRGFSFEDAPIRLASAMSGKEAIDYLSKHDNVAVALTFAAAIGCNSTSSMCWPCVTRSVFLIL